VDLTIVWKTLENDLPELQAQMQTVVESHNNDPGTNGT
jgi:uncharacterized protein with HEPN domain